MPIEKRVIRYGGAMLDQKEIDAVAAGLTIYLIYALIHPERF
jgi:K+-transporting ATPase KdpF subunit